MRRPPRCVNGWCKIGAAREERYGFPLGILAFSIHRLNWQNITEKTITLTEAGRPWREQH